MTGSDVALERIKSSDAYNLISLHESLEDNDGTSENDSPFQFCNSECSYFEPDEFQKHVPNAKNSVSYFHLNCRGLSANWEAFHNLLCNLHSDSFSFDFIGISELYRCENDTRLSLPGYHKLIARCRDDGPRGGVGLFIKDNVNYKIRDDISVFIPHIFESVFIEVMSKSERNTIVGVIYRPNTEPRADIDIFSSNLEDIMDTMTNENLHGVILGDMNLDLLRFQTHVKTNNFLDGIFSHGFLPLITKPTRICSTSATLIDHILTNDIISPHQSGIIINDVADHFGTFCILHGKNKHNNPSQTRSRSFSANNINTFKTSLNEINFDHLLNQDCPNEAYNEFLKLYTSSFEKSFPLHEINTKSRFIKREPWFTLGLVTSSIKRAKLFSKKIHDPSARNKEKYKHYNSLYNKLNRKMKVLYFRTALEENKRNSKRTWSILKQAIGKINDKSSYPQTFNINNKPISDKSTVAEGFNNFFSKIGVQTSHNVPPANRSYSSYMPPSQTHSFFLGPVAPSDIINTTKKLKPKSSYGHDLISNKLLKETIECITEPLTHIINQSFLTGVVPRQMKVAKVIPIYKSSDPSI